MAASHRKLLRRAQGRSNAAPCASSNCTGDRRTSPRWHRSIWRGSTADKLPDEFPNRPVADAGTRYRGAMDEIGALTVNPLAHGACDRTQRTGGEGFCTPLVG